MPAHGGWHGAGDTLKYLITSSNATAQLLLAYQLAPEMWKDRVNDLGQAGPNGRPDVLEEARWGLEWMLRLHPSRDELYHMVGDDRDHSGWRLPQDDQSDYGWGKGGYRAVYSRPRSRASGSTRASRPASRTSSDATRSPWRSPTPRGRTRRQTRAFAPAVPSCREGVLALGHSKEGTQQGNSYGAPYRYKENTWADDMEWGAIVTISSASLSVATLGRV